MRRFCVAILIAVAAISVSAGGAATSVLAAPATTAPTSPANLIW